MNSQRMLSPDDLRARFGSSVRVGADAEISAETIIEMEPNAILTFGDRVSIRRGATLQVSREATLSIGDDVSIGENVFISALVGIRIGDGCGISNMVDIHDVNHRDRSFEHLSRAEWTPYASGFEGAPIIIDSGAIISNKCSIR
jgi:acetyltransferase-like isoleucine patch superfamily enzyme